MNAIISNGDYTARVQLPVERRQLAGALSYLNANHASAYDIKYRCRKLVLYAYDSGDVSQSLSLSGIANLEDFFTAVETFVIKNT